MFALIDTKSATHIAIHIPHDGADRSLPALAAMLEQNSVFIRSGYQELATVTPSMSVILGDTYRQESYGQELTLAISKESAAVLGDDFVRATPEVLTSHAKELKKRADENAKLTTELSFLRQQISTLQEQIKALTEIEA
jgi:hypothetical protein